jgi:NitT/TauT family transport system permease protein
MKTNKNRQFINLKNLTGIIPILIIILIWELSAKLQFFPGQVYFPPFSDIVKEFFNLIQNGMLLKNFFSSFFRVVIGLITGSAAGILVGILMGWNEAFNKILHPIASLLYPIPALGWLPLFMLWFGINEILPIAVVFICSFFPVLYNTFTGIKNVDEGYVRAAKILGANNFKILTNIVIPIASPSIFTGLKLNAGLAWRVIIAAEMIAIPTGIGALMLKAENLIRIDIIIICLALLSVMCYLFERLFTRIENKLTEKWR